MTRALAAAALFLLLAAPGCDRGREKSPEELLVEDTTLAADLARATDAMDDGGDYPPIGLTDDDPPPRPTVTDPPEIEQRAQIERPSPVAPPAAPVPAAPAPIPPARAASGPGCSSPAAADQRRCLLALLAQYDVGLNGAYRELIQRLRSEAGAGAGDPDPASVERLRAAQRSWLVYRDRECRRRTGSREGELWAPVRARCLGQLSDARARELRAM